MLNQPTRRRLFLLTYSILYCCSSVLHPVGANPDAKRLYDDLLSHYNRLIRPVSNNSEVVTVRLGLHLSQLIDLVKQNKSFLLLLLRLSARIDLAGHQNGRQISPHLSVD